MNTADIAKQMREHNERAGRYTVPLEYIKEGDPDKSPTCENLLELVAQHMANEEIHAFLGGDSYQPLVLDMQPDGTLYGDIIGIDEPVITREPDFWLGSVCGAACNGWPGHIDRAKQYIKFFKSAIAQLEAAIAEGETKQEP
jgi:hypothetical protein